MEGGDTDRQSSSRSVPHARNSNKLPMTHACRTTLCSDCCSLKLTLDTTWSCGEFKHLTYSLLNKSLAFIFMRDNSNFSCHALFLSYSYANDLRLLMRQKLYTSYHSSIIKCLSLKSWDINSCLYELHISICIKKQYTSLSIVSYVSSKPTRAIKTDYHL